MHRLLSRGVTLVRLRASARGILLAAVAFGVQATTGCVSNEYRIQKDELRRLAELPPQARGQSVRIGQKLGSRRNEAIEPPAVYPASTYYVPEETSDVYVSNDVYINLNGSFGNGGSRAAPPLRATPTSAGWRGGAPSPGGLRATPPSPSGAAAGGFRGTPSGGGGGGLSLPGVGGGGGGGGSGGDGLAVLVVVLIVGAAVATIALAASEGMLYEGHVEMAPEQVIHLEGPSPHDVRLEELTREEAAAADGALVMDDEGYGLRRLDSAPLDRKGGVFRFELGGGAFNFGDLRVSGFASHIQTGIFPTSRLGILFDLGLGSGTADLSCCVGPVVSDSIGRYSAGLELQAFPLSLGPLHLGAFAGGGVVLVGPSGAREEGPIGSAGALLELEITSHMALAVRGGASTASLPSGWSSAGAVTGGLAIY